MPTLSTRFENENPDGATGSTGLLHVGPRVRVYLVNTVSGQAIQGDALIDTGASLTAFDEEAARSIGLPVVDEAELHTPSGEPQRRPRFNGALAVVDFPQLNVRAAIGCSLAALGLVALIGRDALGSAVFVYNGADGSFSLSI